MSSNNEQDDNHTEQDHNNTNAAATTAKKVEIGAKLCIVVLCTVNLLVFNGQDLMHSVHQLRQPQQTERIEDSFSNSTIRQQEQQELGFSQQLQQQQTSPPRQPPPFPKATLMTPLYYPMREPPFNVSQAELGNCIAYMDNNPPQHGVGPSTDFFRGYRLGDCIRRCKGCGRRVDAYNGTFAKMYKAQACPEILNFTVLGDILRRKENMQGYPKPDPQAVILHLRLGSVMEKSRDNITTMLTHGGDPWHAGDYKGAIRSVYQYMDDLHQTQATKVEIVGGSHKYYQGKSRSMTYAHCLHYALHSAGYEVTMRIGGVNPDQDFYYMSNAKRIMLSGGGYSKLLGQVVVKSGGEIVGPVWGGEGFRYL